MLSSPATPVKGPKPTAMSRYPLGYTVGVVGGGQLGRMMADPVHRLGFRIAVLDPGGADCAAAVMSDRVVHGGLKDAEKCRELAKGCDVVTLEIEHVNTEVLAELEKEGVNVQPSAESVRIIQDKLTQKQHFEKHGVAVPAFMDTPDVAAVGAAAERFGLPLCLKSRCGGYDGRGNAVLKTLDQAQECLDSLGGPPLPLRPFPPLPRLGWLARARDCRSRAGALGCAGPVYAEKWAPFTKELAVNVARSTTGEIAAVRPPSPPPREPPPGAKHRLTRCRLFARSIHASRRCRRMRNARR